MGFCIKISEASTACIWDGEFVVIMLADVPKSTGAWHADLARMGPI